MEFTIAFDCDNDAFQESLESTIAAVLRDVAEGIECNEGTDGAVYDPNGNKIGRVTLS